LGGARVAGGGEFTAKTLRAQGLEGACVVSGRVVFPRVGSQGAEVNVVAPEQADSSGTISVTGV